MKKTFNDIIFDVVDSYVKHRVSEGHYSYSDYSGRYVQGDWVIDAHKDTLEDLFEDEDKFGEFIIELSAQPKAQEYLKDFILKHIDFKIKSIWQRRYEHVPQGEKNRYLEMLRREKTKQLKQELWGSR